MMVQQKVLKHNCVNEAGTVCEGLMHSRCGVRSGHHQTIIQQPDQLSNFDRFRVGSLNVGTMCGCSGEVVETLTWRRIDVCCVQEIRWRGASARMITGKDTQYKMFWVGNYTGFGGVGILLAEKWVEKVIDVD